MYLNLHIIKWAIQSIKDLYLMIWPFLKFLGRNLSNFFRYFGKSKTSKGHSEINWPLHLIHVGVCTLQIPKVPFAQPYQVESSHYFVQGFYLWHFLQEFWTFPNFRNCCLRQHNEVEFFHLFFLDFYPSHALELKSLTSEATPLAIQFFKRFYKSSHPPGL